MNLSRPSNQKHLVTEACYSLEELPKPNTRKVIAQCPKLTQEAARTSAISFKPLMA